jgi:4-hydroxy-tetrahydrodipicolinate reductase
MKISLFGYGKMGKLIEEVALKKKHFIAARMNSKTPFISNDADIYIDFSHHDLVLKNLKHAAEKGKNVVIGTTGWENHLEEAEKIVKRYSTACLYAPNFSIGVYLFTQIAVKAAELIDAFDDYDISLFEIHHNLKKDQPSGTAKAIGDAILTHMERKTKIVLSSEDRPIAPEELQISHIRCGFQPGTHTVVIDAPSDTISLTHTARDRNSFAKGAVAAAEWLLGKQGFFTLKDMFQQE